jgi:structure-specific recognition protein 1
LAGKNEVAVEFALPTDSHPNGTNGSVEGSTKNRGRKAGAGPDELVEMRFYIPGTAVKKEKTDGEEANGEDEKEGEEKEGEEKEGEE